MNMPQISETNMQRLNDNTTKIAVIESKLETIGESIDSLGEKIEHLTTSIERGKGAFAASMIFATAIGAILLAIFGWFLGLFHK